MGGNRRGFRSRRISNFARQSFRTSHINAGPASIAATADNTELLLRTPATIDEDPDHTVISTITTGAEVEENSTVRKIDVTFDIAANAVSAPFVVTFYLWKDDAFGAVAAPTASTDPLAPSTTLQLAALKKNICMYERWLFSPQGDRRRIKLRIPKRLRRLRQGESYQYTIFNASTDTAITFMAYGRITTAH